jgi:hypothetical protein
MPRSPNLSPALLRTATVLLLLACSACSERAPVRVRTLFQGSVPVPDVELTAVPFNPAQLLDSLADVAPTPEPDFSGLEARIRDYRRDSTAAVPQTDATVAWLATRDSVARMSRELARQDRRAPGYREAYARFRQLYARYAARQADRETGLRRFFSKDWALATEASRASDSLRAWENQAYRGFPEVAERTLAMTGREVSRIKTDSVGAAEMELPNGDWWVLARVRDPENPFQELSWSVPIRVSAGLPFSLPLIRANAVSRWRH